MKPDPTATVSNDTIKIIAVINSGGGGDHNFDNYIDTIRIGKLVPGNYVLIHKLFDIGKVYYVADTVIHFSVSKLSNVKAVFDKKDEISIFSNPSNGTIKLGFNDYSIDQECNIVILSVDGKIIFNNNIKVNNHIVNTNLDFLERGIYFIEISYRKTSKIKKIIIN
jgi:hypothetical protein